MFPCDFLQASWRSNTNLFVVNKPPNWLDLYWHLHAECHDNIAVEFFLFDNNICEYELFFVYEVLFLFRKTDCPCLVS